MQDKQKKRLYYTTDEEFSLAVKNSSSIAQAINTLGLNATGANHASAKKRIIDLKLDSSHFTGQGHLKGKRNNYNSLPIEELLVANCKSDYRSHLKKRLLRDGLLINKCTICGNEGIWNNKPITLQMDHINGDNRDNRIDNLRILCPNCHSQTDTFCSRNNKVRTNILPQKSCVECNNVVFYKSERCRSCDQSRRKDLGSLNYFVHKGYDFSFEDATKMFELSKSSISLAAKEFNINRSTVRDTLKKYELYSKLDK